MSRTATGAVLVSALIALFLGPELGFGPITSTSRADARPPKVPEAQPRLGVLAGKDVWGHREIRVQALGNVAEPECVSELVRRHGLDVPLRHAPGGNLRHPPVVGTVEQDVGLDGRPVP